MDDIYIYNPLTKEVHTKAFGNHFSFKAGQIKRMRHEIGDFIVKEKAYLGLVEVSVNFDDPSYKETEEGKAELESKRKQGIERRVRHLQWQVDNLQVSLRADLDTAGIKIPDVLTQATDGDMDAMEELRDLQRAKEDANKVRLEKARQLQRQIQANSTGLVNKKD